MRVEAFLLLAAAGLLAAVLVMFGVIFIVVVAIPQSVAVGVCYFLVAWVTLVRAVQQNRGAL